MVATHKKYRMPKESIYFPVHVGREGKEDLGYVGDNTGENISLKNKNYCELTGMYWTYKNIECDYIGLCHYRRYFTKANILKRQLNKKSKFDILLSEDDIKCLLNSADIILPKKRNYYIETIKTHYDNAHNSNDLIKVKEIVLNKYPEYKASFEKVMNGKKIYLFNMFIMKKDDYDAYCKWLFDILFELEKQIDISKYDQYQSRVFGFLSERLFNIWIEKQNFKIKELPVINMEKVNWFEKIKKFLNRKFK